MVHESIHGRNDHLPRQGEIESEWLQGPKNPALVLASMERQPRRADLGWDSSKTLLRA